MYRNLTEKELHELNPGAVVVHEADGDAYIISGKDSVGRQIAVRQIIVSNPREWKLYVPFSIEDAIQPDKLRRQTKVAELGVLLRVLHLTQSKRYRTSNLTLKGLDFLVSWMLQGQDYESLLESMWKGNDRAEYFIKTLEQELP